MNAYTPLIPMVLMLMAFALRRFTPTTGFLHTPPGAWLIALVSGVLGAVAHAIQTGGVSTGVVVPAIASFIMSFLATANPSMAPLLAFALLGLVASCQTAGGQALKACEIGQLKAQAQDAVVTGLNIASNPGSAVSDLEAAALRYLPGQFECAMEALAAWLTKQAPATTGEALAAASVTAQSWHALDVVTAYLVAHKPPSACGARTVM